MRLFALRQKVTSKQSRVDNPDRGKGVDFAQGTPINEPFKP
jgi:hypothetical protein